MIEGAGSAEFRVALHRRDHIPLNIAHIFPQERGSQVGGGMAAVEAVILHPVVALEKDEIRDAGYNRLTVLRTQEFLQIIVAQRGIFDVNLSHDAYPDLGDPVYGDGGEIVGDMVELLPHMTAPKAAGAAEILYQFIHPFPDAAVGFPFHQFIGAGIGWPYAR